MANENQGVNESGPSRDDESVAAGSATSGQSSDTIPSSEPSPPDECRSFMVALATDPAKLGAFIKDPDAVMKEYGISDVDQVILKSAHPATIHARLSGQRFSFMPSPVSVLGMDMTRAPDAVQSAATEHPSLRFQSSFTGIPSQGSSTMFSNVPLQIVPPQIFPQIHPQIVHPLIFPQFG